MGGLEIKKQTPKHKRGFLKTDRGKKCCFLSLLAAEESPEWPGTLSPHTLHTL